MASFSLFSTVKFPTRIFNISSTLIDNIYINTNSHNFSVYPLINGLSDHDAQVLTLFNFFRISPRLLFSFSRRINSNSVCQFTDLLSYENWENVFLENNINIYFNNFLNTYLRNFYACFPPINIHKSSNSKPLLTTGIRISCTNKHKLYLTYWNSNDPNFKQFYKKYCKILSSVIPAAKKMHFDKLISNSTNRSRTTWNIVKTITNNKDTTSNVTTMNVNNSLTSNPLSIANAFNSYFSTVAEDLIAKNFSGETHTNNNDSLTFLRQNLNKAFLIQG